MSFESQRVYASKAASYYYVFHYFFCLRDRGWSEFQLANDAPFLVVWGGGGVQSVNFCPRLFCKKKKKNKQNIHMLFACSMTKFGKVKDVCVCVCVCVC